MDESTSEKKSPESGTRVPFEGFCRVVEGVNWADLSQNSPSQGDIDEAQVSSSILWAKELGSRQLYSFVDEKGIPAPLEVLWLKWRLFVWVCERVVSWHRQFQQPYLAINPDAINIWIPSEADSLLPYLWNFSATLESRFSPKHFEISASPPLRKVVPAVSGKPVFQSPEVRDWSSGCQRDVTVVLLSLEQLRGQEADPTEIEGQVKLYIPSKDSFWADISLKDIFEIQVRQKHQTGQSPINIWASKMDNPEGGVVLNGKTSPIPLAQWEMWRASGEKVFADSTVRVHRDFQVPSDIYSLGILLFYILVGTKSGGLSRLEMTLPKIASKLQGIGSIKGKKDWDRCINSLKTWCHQEGNLFRSPQVDAATVNLPVRVCAIPHGLWDRVILLGFRLISRVSNFGFCENRDSYDPLNPHLVMEQVASEARLIGMQLTKELFGFSRRNREIGRACEKLRKELYDNLKPVNL